MQLARCNHILITYLCRDFRVHTRARSDSSQHPMLWYVGIMLSFSVTSFKYVSFMVYFSDLQKLQDKDVILKCLYDFEGEEEDELSISQGQVLANGPLTF